MAIPCAWRLGLDVGSDSIGWAVFRLDRHGNPEKLLAGSVRLFNSGRDPERYESYMRQRGMKRRGRRRLRAKAWRQEQLKALLVGAGLALPNQPIREIWPLRAKAACERIGGTELAAVLQYILRHRGFKSPKLASDATLDKASKEGKGYWEDIESRLTADMVRGETAGQLLARRLLERGYVRVRRGQGEAPTRPMIADELKRIRTRQESYHTLVPADWDAIFDLILEQRPIREPRPGKCRFFPDEDRLAKAMPSAQRFLVRQTLCNLRVTTGMLGSSRQLNEEEFALLVAILDEGGTHTWASLRKAIKLGRAKFTVEQERREGQKKTAARETKGDETTALLKELIPHWKNMVTIERDEVVRRLLAVRRDRRKLMALACELGVGDEAAEQLADTVQFGLPRGYLALGETAVSRVLGELKAGVESHEAFERALGRSHSDLRPGRLLACLPYYGEVLAHRVIGASGDPSDPTEMRFGRIGNVTVHIALNEIRKIVNKLIHRYGPPAMIVVETTRELKANTEQLIAMRTEQARRERENEKLEDEIKADVEATIHGAKGETTRAATSRRERLRRIRLAKRQANFCVYTGQQIGRADIFTAAYQIDHIIPLSRGGTDAFDNLVLCRAGANAEKLNRTPWEAWHEDKPKWEIVDEQAKALPKEMHWRFGQDAMKRIGEEDEGWAPRQILDTSYIARVTMEYLRHVAPEVVATKGALTAYLRAAWRLPKNRFDQRHHFVDAAVIALTDRRYVQMINTLHARGPLPKATEAGIPIPYDNFTAHMERTYDRLWPSLRPDHSGDMPSGELHDEIPYTLRRDGDDGTNKWRLAGRKPIGDLFRKDGRAIDDEDAEAAINSFVSQRFQVRFREAISAVRAAAPRVSLAEAALQAAQARQFGPRGIGKVLCWREGAVPDPERVPKVPRSQNDPLAAHLAPVYAKPKAWLEIYRSGKRWTAKVVPKFDAAVGRARPTSSPGLVCMLRRNDTIAWKQNGSTQIGFVKVIRETDTETGRFYAWPLRLARSMKAAEAFPEYRIPNRDGISFSAETFRARKGRRVTVSILGRLRDPGPIDV